MQIETVCPQCQKGFVINAGLSDKKVRCSTCKHVFRVAAKIETVAEPAFELTRPKTSVKPGSPATSKSPGSGQAKPSAKPATRTPPAKAQPSPYESLAASLLNDPKGKKAGMPRGRSTGFENGTDLFDFGSQPESPTKSNFESASNILETGDATFSTDNLNDDSLFAEEQFDETGFDDPVLQATGSSAGFNQTVRPNKPAQIKKRFTKRKKAEFNEARAQTGYSIMGLGIIGMFAPLFGLELKFIGFLGEGYWLATGLIILLGCGFVISASIGNMAKGLAIAAAPALIACGGIIFSIVLISGILKSGSGKEYADNSFSRPSSANSSRPASPPSTTIPSSNTSTTRRSGMSSGMKLPSPEQRESAEDVRARMEQAFGMHEAARLEAQRQWETAQAEAARRGLPTGSRSTRNPTRSESGGSTGVEDAFGLGGAMPTTPWAASRGSPGYPATLDLLSDGLPIHILEGSIWYQGNVVSVQGNRVLIHYEGYSENFDETVDVSRIRLINKPASMTNPAAESVAGTERGNDSGSVNQNAREIVGDFPESDQRQLTSEIGTANRKLDGQFKVKYGAWIWSRDQAHMISPAAGKVGAFPVYVVHPERTPIVGANVSWNHDQNSIGSVGPVFEMNAGARFQVRDGYMISGVNVNSDEKVRGIQFVCSRILEGRPDPGDSYSSDWYGIPAVDDAEKSIGGDGRMVYGFWVTQGIRGLESVGLVIEPAK